MGKVLPLELTTTISVTYLYVSICEMEVNFTYCLSGQL